MNKLIFISIFSLAVSSLVILSIPAAAEDFSSENEPIAASELTLDAGDKIKGTCRCFPKGNPKLGTVIGTNISVNDCCKNQSKTQQCNLTESGGRVWGCLDKKIAAEETF